MFKCKTILLIYLIAYFSITHGKENLKNIELNFQHIRISQALNIIAKLGKFNIIVNDDVKGCLNLYLKNANWQQVFTTILKTKNLMQQKIGNVMIIGMANHALENAKKHLQTAVAMENLMPLESKIFHIQYGKASYYY